MSGIPPVPTPTPGASSPPPPPSGPSAFPPLESKSARPTVTLLIVLGILIFLAATLRGSGNAYWRWDLFYSALAVAYFFLSLKQVATNETGTRIFFGDPVDNAESGLTVVPFLLFKLVTLPKTAIQLEIPGEPQDVWKGDDDKLPAGKIPPVRITHAEPAMAMKFDTLSVPDENDPEQVLEEMTKAERDALKSDPLHGRLVSEVSAFVRFKIRNGRQFLGSIESPEDAQKQIVDTIVSTLQDIIAQLTPAYANANKRRISSMVCKRVEELCGERTKPGESEEHRQARAWGITIEDVEVKLFDWRHRVNEAIANRAEAAVNKQQTIITAEGEKEKRILEGQGDAEAAKVLAAEMATPEGEAAARLRTMREVAGKSQFMILPNNDVFGAAAGIAQVIQRKPPGSPGTPPAPTP